MAEHTLGSRTKFHPVPGRLQDQIRQGVELVRGKVGHERCRQCAIVLRALAVAKGLTGSSRFAHAVLQGDRTALLDFLVTDTRRGGAPAGCRPAPRPPARAPAGGPPGGRALFAAAGPALPGPPLLHRGATPRRPGPAGAGRNLLGAHAPALRRATLRTLTARIRNLARSARRRASAPSNP